MPLLWAGIIDKLGGIVYVISLLGTEPDPEEATRSTSSTAVAGWRFNADGTTDRRQGSWSAGYDDWATPTSGTPGNGYEIRATLLSGDTPTTGNLSTWEALSSTITWELSNSTASTTLTCDLKIEIRDTSTQTVQDTGYYRITATKTSGGTTTTVTTITTETTVSQ